MPSSGERTGGLLSVTLRRMTAADVASALCILRESPEASMWSKESLLESVTQGVVWAAELEGILAGFLVGRAATDEFEILNLAVAKACRRRGVATRLVRATIEFAQTAGARKTYLEVRASNEGGTAFYARLGFCVIGRRPNYYRNPAEDAILLVLRVSEPNP